MRQTDSLPMMDKCFMKTPYYNQIDGGTTRLIFPTCIYLKNGKCQLNGCIKNFRRDEDGYQENYS